jgi:ribosome biogenesis protein Tsr3
MSMYISSLTVAIPVNYTSDFQELFEATLYILDADNWYYQIIMHYRYGSSKTAYRVNTP